MTIQELHKNLFQEKATVERNWGQRNCYICKKEIEEGTTVYLYSGYGWSHMMCRKCHVITQL